MSWSNWLTENSPERIEAQAQQYREIDVLRALQKAGHAMTEDDLIALLSPAAASHLPAIAERSYHLTRQHFGHNIHFYVPLYLSNRCANHCTYCGFSRHIAQKRTTLNIDQIHAELRAIKKRGFNNVLLVTGESHKVGADYLAQAANLAHTMFSMVGLEVQSLSDKDYERMSHTGVDYIPFYQETYHQDTYEQVHLAGPKADYQHRLATPARIAKAGIRKVGLGVLLGLGPWRYDVIALARHLRWLEKRFWRTAFSVSLPRLRPCAASQGSSYQTPSDQWFLQIIMALRLWSPTVEIVLSTREPSQLRDRLLPFGVTHISAGSSTQPGGYAEANVRLRQFEIDDQRTPQEIATVIRKLGLQPVWTDWRSELSQPIELSL